MKIILLFFVSITFAQNVKFQIRDSITYEPIKFVSVDLLNGYGCYSNEYGEVKIDISDIRRIKLSHLSYKLKEIDIQNVPDIIYLVEKTIYLNEVIINNDVKKVFYSQKRQGFDENLFCGFGAYGFEIAIPLHSPIDNECFLQEITIPINIDKQWMKLADISELPLSLIRINFTKNLNDKPSDTLLFSPEYYFIDKKTLKRKAIIYELHNELIIPKEGLFCVITFLGKANVEGNLIFEMPTYKKNVLGKDIIFTKYQPLQIPIYNSKSKNSTYSRDSFLKNSKFLKVVPPISIPIYFNAEERATFLKSQLEIMTDYSVSIGYKFYYYE
jgi:hypothetical protein